MNKKRLIIKTEKGVAYFFHMLAVSGISFDNEYTQKYKDTVSAEDIKYLKEQKELLSFGNGKSTLVIYIMLFFPAYINLDSKEKISEYFTILKNCLEINDFTHFLNRYKEAVENQKNWTYNINNQFLKAELTKYKHIINGLGKIYINNFEAFDREVWMQEKPKLEDKARLINEQIKNTGFIDIIDKWEKLTKLDFLYNNYQIILLSSTNNGPDWNSLGYEKNVFYYNSDIDNIIDGISHETGTHILIDILKKVWQEKLNYEPNKLYSAFESLAKFYNYKILDKEYLNYDMSNFSDSKYYTIYDQIMKDQPQISSYNLYLKALEKLQN